MDRSAHRTDGEFKRRAAHQSAVSPKPIRRPPRQPPRLTDIDVAACDRAGKSRSGRPGRDTGQEEGLHGGPVFGREDDRTRAVITVAGPGFAGTQDSAAQLLEELLATVE